MHSATTTGCSDKGLTLRRAFTAAVLGVSTGASYSMAFLLEGPRVDPMYWATVPLVKQYAMHIWNHRANLPMLEKAWTQLSRHIGTARWSSVKAPIASPLALAAQDRVGYGCGLHPGHP